MPGLPDNPLLRLGLHCAVTRRAFAPTSPAGRPLQLTARYPELATTSRSTPFAKLIRFSSQLLLTDLTFNANPWAQTVSYYRGVKGLCKEFSWLQTYSHNGLAKCWGLFFGEHSVAPQWNCVNLVVVDSRHTESQKFRESGKADFESKEKDWPEAAASQHTTCTFDLSLSGTQVWHLDLRS